MLPIQVMNKFRTNYDFLHSTKSTNL